ncbi:VLRF1 family aeRF1-type release factor [Deinococcus maricopensis]|uniref:Peptide chain release factor 3 n=1 Tax=Deinococcus maricopensis (strain DSM 21211 / LMG 22137 / NRRL B-23946 / LB-34) TaxID=709986 RepID=E8UBK6_DEIML|nr:VLRF1 family aeRF1-type release factor [Deinococcus maricopensis]ADV68445.1 hypothetical protein Deima_2816 [Deinococcus maricopensis DSM 21211]
MITRADIDRIKALPEDAMVLMAVINDNPANPDNAANGLTTRVKVEMQDAGVPPTVMNQILEDLGRSRSTYGKSAFYLVGHDQFERFELQVDLPERFHYGRPLLPMLDDLLERMPSVGVLAVDREWARFFMVRQGEIIEVRRDENVRLDDGDRWDTMVSGTRHVPGAPGAGGAGRGQPGSGPRSDSGTDLFEKRESAAQQRFYNQMADQLTRHMRALGLKHLVLVGPVQRLAEFRAEIASTAPYEVIGETNVSGGASWADPQQILERVMNIIEDHQVKEEARLLSDIQEKGIMEVETVLDMVQQSRLHLIVVPESGEQMHVYRSHNREVPYFTSKKDVASSPLDGSLMERVTLEEVLPDLETLYGVTVRRVHGDFADRLVQEYGGLAGLPRY